MWGGSCGELELLALQYSGGRKKAVSILLCDRGAEGTTGDALCEVDVEEVQVETRLDNSGCHCYWVYQAFCEISVFRGDTSASVVKLGT